MAEFISDTSETKQIETKNEANPHLQPFVAEKLYQGGLLEYYNAGLPGYESNFSRDDAVSAILSGDSHLLQTHLAMCVRFQATETNARNGAYPGKIHHGIHIGDQEVAQISLEGREDRSTEYNSCDSTALSLIGVEQLRMVDPGAYTEFIRKYSDNVHAAAIHIMEMLDENGLFTDNPPKAPGEGPNAPGRFGLRVTYWKDSVLPSVNAKEEPRYPVSYALAHFIAARGMLSAAATLESQYYADTADRMYQRGIATFMREDGFTIYQDGDGPYVQASSDELHSLAYIPNYYSHLLPLAAIRQRAEQLETPFERMSAKTCATPTTVIKCGFSNKRLLTTLQKSLHLNMKPLSPHRFNPSFTAGKNSLACIPTPQARLWPYQKVTTDSFGLWRRSCILIKSKHVTSWRNLPTASTGYKPQRKVLHKLHASVR